MKKNNDDISIEIERKNQEAELRKEFKSPEDAKSHFLKVFFTCIVGLWLTLALGNMSLDDAEVNLLHKEPIVRCIVMFIFIYVIFFYEKTYPVPLKILASFVIVLLYALVIERNNFFK